MHQPHTVTVSMTRVAQLLFAAVAFSVHAVDASAIANTCALPGLPGDSFAIQTAIHDTNCGDTFAVNLNNLEQPCVKSPCNLTVGSSDHSLCCTTGSTCGVGCPSGMVPIDSATGSVKCDGSVCFPQQGPPPPPSLTIDLNDAVKCQYLASIAETNLLRCCKAATCSDPVDVVGVTTVVVDNSTQTFKAHVSCTSGYYDSSNSLGNVKPCTEPDTSWSYSGNCTPCSEYPLPPTPAGEAVICTRCSSRTYAIQKGIKTTQKRRCLEATCPSGTFNPDTNVCTSAATRVTAHMLLVLCVVLCYSS